MLVPPLASDGQNVRVPRGNILHVLGCCALLRWMKECRGLWVLLASAVQASIHSVAYMYIDSYQFLSVISNVLITCTYPITSKDNHLQKSTILSVIFSDEFGKTSQSFPVVNFSL